MSAVNEPADLGFVHRFEPARDPAMHQRRTLLLLHGTGGDENDLIPLGRALLPDAALLSPRGRVLEHGMPRFFRRLAEGVFDLDDLRRRAAELARFVAKAAQVYGFDPARVYAMGFSNGANIAAAVLLLHPATLAGGALFRAMVPLEPDAAPDLTGKRVLLSEGRADPIVPVENAERLAALLRAGGADVSLVWQQAGHNLTQADVDAARAWFEAAR